MSTKIRKKFKITDITGYIARGGGRRSYFSRRDFGLIMVKKPQQSAIIPKKGLTGTKKLLIWVRLVFAFIVGIDMQIKVHCGRGFIDLQVPDRNIGQFIQPWRRDDLN